MNDRELLSLQHAAAGELLFHKGTWGGPPGYRWRGPDGAEAGEVPPWEQETLSALEAGGYITVERRLGPADRIVFATSTGLNTLTDETGIRHAA